MIDAATLEGHVRILLSGLQLRITPTELSLSLRSRLPGISSAQIRQVVRKMVEAGELVYTNHFSINHLELNHLGSSPISNRIPIDLSFAKTTTGGARVEICLSNGSAFGRGDHPTTRLMLRGVDRAIKLLGRRTLAPEFAALDVGTGTGVLALAAVRLGAHCALGVDTDPIACHEAAVNVRNNGLQESVVIVAGSLDTVGSHKFDLVMANLRPPTLSALLPQLEAVSKMNSQWVLSGFRPSEALCLEKHFPVGLRVEWHETEQNWGAMGVVRD